MNKTTGEIIMQNNIGRDAETHAERLIRTANIRFRRAQELALQGKPNANGLEAVAAKLRSLGGFVNGIEFDQKGLAEVTKRGVENNVRLLFVEIEFRRAEGTNTANPLAKLTAALDKLTELNGGAPLHRSLGFDVRRRLKRASREPGLWRRQKQTSGSAAQRAVLDRRHPPEAVCL